MVRKTISLSVEPETVVRIDKTMPEFATRSKWAERLILDRLKQIEEALTASLSRVLKHFQSIIGRIPFFIGKISLTSVCEGRSTPNEDHLH